MEFSGLLRKFEIKEWLGLLPIIPALGFAAAYLYESVYFYSLGIRMVSVLDITDIVKSSIFAIIPIVILVVGTGTAVFVMRLNLTSDEKSISYLDKTFGVNGVDVLRVASICVALVPIIAHFLFGSMRMLIPVAIPSLLLFVIIPYISMVARRVGGRVGNRAVFSFVLIAFFAPAKGYQDSDIVRFGPRSEFPILQSIPYDESADTPPFHVIRRLSANLLVGSDVKDRLWLVNSDGNQIIEFSVNDNRFRGVLCDMMDWCSDWMSFADTDIESTNTDAE